jgi:hypothetical protein
MTMHHFNRDDGPDRGGRGFLVAGIVLVILVVGALGCAGFWVWEVVAQ